MSGDGHLFADCFALPQEMDTFHGRRMMHCRADLIETFEAVVAHFRKRGVTDLARTIVAAEFADRETIHMTHVSRLLRGTELLQEPYPCFSIIRRIDGVWLLTFTQYAITDTPEHNTALSGRAAPDTDARHH